MRSTREPALAPSSFAEAHALQVLFDCKFPGGLSGCGDPMIRKYSRFTRDYLVAMSDLMDIYPSLAREGFSQIPQEQGVIYDPLTEEEPGRLPQQVARGLYGGIKVPDKIIAEERFWAELWKVPYDEHSGFTVYNATDGIRYIVELGRFCERYGTEVLYDEFLHRKTGEIRTVRAAALALMDWLVRSIQRSEGYGAGLFEVAGTNAKQTSWSGVMRSGIDAYYHPNKEYEAKLNRNYSIAYIENQGMAVDAFKAALKLFPEHQTSEQWRHYAAVLPRRAIEYFWMPQDNYFAAALDRDNTGKPRQVQLLSSAPMELLATSLFDELPEKHDIIDAILAKIYSPNFMTPVGVRMLDLVHASEEGDYYPYDGSGMVWGVVQRRISAGLRRLGLMKLARQLGTERFIGGINRSQAFLEYWIADKSTGAVNYSHYSSKSKSGVALATVGLPKQKSLWTVSGAMAERTDSMRQRPEVDQALLLIEKKYHKLAASLPVPAAEDTTSQKFYIDFERGIELSRRHVQRIVGDVIFTHAPLEINGEFI
jgi:glycogen debranching enzyme